MTSSSPTHQLPLPAKLATRNPRVAVSLYFVILCVTLGWLYTSSTMPSSSSSHHTVVKRHQQAHAKSSSSRFFDFKSGVKNYLPELWSSSSKNGDNNNNINREASELAALSSNKSPSSSVVHHHPQQNRASNGQQEAAAGASSPEPPTTTAIQSTTEGEGEPVAPATTEEEFAGIQITEEEKSFAEHLGLTVALLALSATFAGLTLGIMGLDTVTLEVIAEAAPEPDRSYAKTILPVRHLGHQCLCTLILGNMWANVMIANVSSDIIPSEGGGLEGGGASAILAFLLSTFLILIFAEILPMSICTGPSALKVAAAMVPLLKVFIFILYPIAKPLGWMLDKFLHHDPGQIYDREELKKLFVMHAQKHQTVSGLKNSELDLLLGAFDFGDRTVKNVMTPFETVVVLRSDAILDAKLLRLLWACGHSRFPIIDGSQLPPLEQQVSNNAGSPGLDNNNNQRNFSNNNNNNSGGGGGGVSIKNSLKVPADMLSKVQIIGLLFVKDLLLVMDQNLTVEEVLDLFPHGEVYSVWQQAKLRHLLTSFQQGVTHLVFVRENQHGNEQDEEEEAEQNHVQRADTLSVVSDEDKIVGIVTLEALIETLIRAPIFDEHDDEEAEQLRIEQKEQNEQEELRQKRLLEEQQQNENNNNNTNNNSNNNRPPAITISNGDNDDQNGDNNGEQQQPSSPVDAVTAQIKQQHQVLRLRRQMKSVHFFDFVVSREDARRIPEGTAINAPQLTSSQCLAIGRFLRQSVDSFTPFTDDALIAKLVVGSECLILNPRTTSSSSNNNNNNNEIPHAAHQQIQLQQQQLLQQSQQQDNNNNNNNNENTTYSSSSLAREQLSSISPVAHTALHGPFSNALDLTVGSSTSASATVVGAAAMSMVHNAAAAAALAPKITKDIRSPATTLYTRGERAEHFTIILGGSVRIIAGRERFHHEIHTFSWLGEHALTSSDGFIPTFDAFAVTPCKILRIHTRAFNAVRSVASLNSMANAVSATARYSTYNNNNNNN